LKESEEKFLLMTWLDQSQKRRIIQNLITG